MQVSIWISKDKKKKFHKEKSQTCRPEKQHGHGVYENPKYMFGLILLAAVDTSARKSANRENSSDWLCVVIDCCHTVFRTHNL